MLLEEAVEALKKCDIEVVRADEKMIRGGINVTRFTTETGLEQVDVDDPFTVMRDDNLWLVAFPVGLFFIIIKCSLHLSDVIEAVCNYYKIQAKHAEIVQGLPPKYVSSVLFQLERRGFIVEIASAPEIHVKPTKLADGQQKWHHGKVMLDSLHLINPAYLFIIRLETAGFSVTLHEKGAIIWEKQIDELPEAVALIETRWLEISSKLP